MALLLNLKLSPCAAALAVLVVGPVWAQTGAQNLQGVTVTSSAPALGSYDVRYQGMNYLIRAEAAGEATRVTAFTSEGAAAANSPAGRLLGILKSRLE